VSTTTPELIRSCKRCSHPLALGALVCEQCHTLVHSEELERLAAEAKALEASGESQRARETWLTALQLLPSTSTQAEWIKQHVQQLDGSRSQSLAAPALIALPAAKARSTLRVQLTSLLSFAAFIAIYSAASGMKFGIGFAVLILIHEMGHFIDIKRRGLPADMPVFLPGLGAYVRWQALGVPLETRAAVSLAGPLAGFFASLVCAALWWQTHNPLWASLARSGAILNLLNLIPVWVLDGGQAALALSKAERIALLVVSVALGLMLGQRMFFLVALGFGYQAYFAGHLPARPSLATTIYFAAVLAALGVVIRLMPGTGLGMN
jgi:Zn-dependent protease